MVLTLKCCILFFSIQMSPTTPRIQRQRTQVQSASHPHHGRVSQASRTGTKQGEPEGGKRPLSGTSETSEDDEVITIKMLVLIYLITLPNSVSIHSMHCYPRISPMQPFNAKSIAGIISCQVPIYFTWVGRDNCGQNTLSRSICTEWDFNP